MENFYIFEQRNRSALREFMKTHKLKYTSLTNFRQFQLLVCDQSVIDLLKNEFTFNLFDQNKIEMPNETKKETWNLHLKFQYLPNLRSTKDMEHLLNSRINKFIARRGYRYQWGNNYVNIMFDNYVDQNEIYKVRILLDEFFPTWFTKLN